MALLANITAAFSILSFYYISALLNHSHQKVSKNTWFVMGFASALFLLLNLIPGLTVKDVKIFSSGEFQLIFGQWNNVFFLLAVTIIALGYINFFSAIWKKRDGIENVKFYYILFGMSIMYINLIVFDVAIPTFFQNYEYTWLPPTLSILDVIIVGYAVIVQRFKSIRYILSQILKSLFSLGLGAIAGFISFEATRSFFPGRENYFIAHLISFLGLLIVYKKTYNLMHSENFHRLFGITNVELFLKVIKKFQRKNNAHATLKEFETDLQQAFHDKLAVDRVKIVLLDAETYKKYPHLIQYCHHQHKILVTKEIAFVQQQDKKSFDFFKELKSLGEICLPLHNPSEKLLGFFILGKKVFDAVYTKEEIEAVENFNSYLSLNLMGILYNSELKQNNQELELKNKQISLQNKEISGLLNEKTKLIAQQSDFIAVTGHELKTPLAIAILRIDDMFQNVWK